MMARGRGFVRIHGTTSVGKSVKQLTSVFDGFDVFVSDDVMV